MSNLIKSIGNNSWIELTARWFLGITFIYASFHKIVSPADFAKIVFGYNLFPEISINLIAIIIPFLELISGLALIIGVYPRSAAIIINVLLLAFITVLTINMIRGHVFDCGCFSAEKNGSFISPELTIVRDIIYFALGLQIILFSGSRRFSFQKRR
ncbi:MAG: MauE/DoxX family redox-associated membrane protein [Desulfobacterales bacterium]